MNKRSEGAWLINHTKKLLEFQETQDFEDIELAGKCGLFLSSLAASDEISELNADKVSAIAKSSNIKKTEIDTIKNKLADAQLIDLAKNGSISVLGITTSTVLSHTSDIFKSVDPNKYQQAAIDLSENISNLPKGEKILKEYISDIYALAAQETADLFQQSEQIGFVDYEALDDQSKLYFNGNLFRKGSAAKTSAVLSSLKSEDGRKIVSLDALINERGCVTEEKAKAILGETLLSKLQSIGMYDFNEVSNPRDTKIFVTKPSAFAKFGNPFEEDALDLAKAFVSSLYYGMNFSYYSRGKITMLKALMRHLIAGRSVGPATAIGQDYKILELKRVVKLTKDKIYPDRYYMKLLKKDIGELAMQVLEFGDIAEQSVLTFSSGSVIEYKGPEENRFVNRKKQNQQSKKSVAEMLRTFRS